MAAPTASVVDNFNRAGPGLGANWGTYAAAGSPLVIASSTVLRNDGGYDGSVFTAQDESRPCEVGIDLVSDLLDTPAYFGLMLLDTPTSTASNDDGYKVGTDTDADPEELHLYRVDNGDTDTAVLDSYTPANINSISEIWLQLDATHARVWVNEGAGLTEVMSAADATYSGPFFPVIDIFDNAGEVTLDNLRFGAIAGGTDYQADPASAAATAAGNIPTVTTLTRPYVLTTIS